MTRDRGRLGLFAYPGMLVAEMASQLVRRHFYAELRHASSEGSSDVRSVLETIRYAELGLGVIGIVALVWAAQVPRSSRAPRRFRAAAVVSAAYLALEAGEPLLFRGFALGGTGGAIETWFKAVSFAFLGLHVALVATLGLGLLAIGRGAGVRAMKPVVAVTWAAIGIRAVALLLPKESESTSAAIMVSYYVGTIALATGCALAAWASPRLAADAPRAASPYREGASAPDAAEDERLSPAWASAAGGISLYLWAMAAKIGCAALSYLTVSGIDASGGYSSLHQAHDGMLLVTILSAGASLAALGGVFRISRAPDDSGAGAPASLALGAMLMGLLVELYGASTTLSALGGSLSAAFSAMDAMPWILGFTAVLGCATSWGLGGAVAALAHRLALADAEKQARSVPPLVTIAAAIIVVAAIVKAPNALVVFIGVIVLPMAAVALIRFLTSSLVVARTIRDRLDDAAPASISPPGGPRR